MTAEKFKSICEYKGITWNDLVRIRIIRPKKFLGFFRQLTGITIEGAFNRCSACADIMKWCDKNMIKYNKELKESRSTKKHCEGLRKHIANLERRLLRHTLANVILSIISVATIIALFTLIQN